MSVYDEIDNFNGVNFDEEEIFGQSFNAPDSGRTEKSKKSSVLRCSFCGNGMEDYLHSGLVGCAQCYRFFKEALEPYVVRLQGNVDHQGKTPSSDPKYEAAQTLRELLLERKAAEEEKDTFLIRKLSRNIEELKLLLFGEDEEE